MHASAASPPIDRRAAATALLGVVATALYLLACHHAIEVGSAWTPWLMLAPGSATLIGAVAYRFGRVAGLLAAALIVAGVAAAHSWLMAHGAVLYVAEHAGFNLALASLFGLSLRDARGPLITRLARHVRGGVLPDGVEHYTRRVTQMWAAAFVAIAATSVLLFVAAPLPWWSAFANLATMPLVALLFVGEYVVRRIVLRGIDHSRLIDGVRAFRAHSRADGTTQREP
ncbi:MAG TPA: acyl carrier protein [Methylibium sp.]|uniref:acyl carrier protein n=1 Tax=Methylibium sp. TaxID=2067992 RepID=UPI002DBC0A02|nr:acyl carrier protein [Methylibium sp.]HEU4458195.1 acyl carrier protein [Methylibium sp.]